jgi:hypothetical protein
MNLANAYKLTVFAATAPHNIEQAITAYQQALTVRTRENHARRVGANDE